MAGFRFNDNLPFVKENARGVWYEDGQFIHAKFASNTANFSEILRWQLTPNPQKKEKKADDFRVKCIYDPSFLSSTDDMVVWLGHASFFIRIGGITLLTDPCLTDLPLIKRLVVPPCPIPALNNINYLLLSHGHRDHFDEKVIRQLISQNPSMSFLLPLEISQLLGKQRNSVLFQEAAWWQQFAVKDDLEITFLPAKHWNRRYLNDLNRQLWGSFWIKYRGTTIYFGGDSAYDTHFSEIREVMGEPDICLLPIGAYRPSYIMKPAHMNPAEAAQAFQDLGGKIMVPMHYGTYDLSDEPLGEPLQLLLEIDKMNRLSGELKALAVGEVLPLKTTKS
jgi:L-ascorbate metabolism protein UlaG (beta-lactamase superfamily)